MISWFLSFYCWKSVCNTMLYMIFSVWLRISFNPADIDRFWTHTGKPFLLQIDISLDAQTFCVSWGDELMQLEMSNYHKSIPHLRAFPIWVKPNFENQKHQRYGEICLEAVWPPYTCFILNYAQYWWECWQEVSALYLLYEPRKSSFP